MKKKKEKKPFSIPLIGFMSVPPRELIEPDILYDEIEVSRALNNSVRPLDLALVPA